MAVTTGATKRAKFQSNRHQQQTNTQFFTGRMLFLSPNQQCHSTEGKHIHSMDLITKLTWSLPVMSLTTEGSWLPWGGLPTLS